MRYHLPNRGFTLLEITVTSAISAVIVLGAMQYASLVSSFQEQSDKKIETINSAAVGERSQSNDLENTGFQFGSPRLAFHLHNNVTPTTHPTGFRYYLTPPGGTQASISVITNAEMDWLNPMPTTGILNNTDVFDAFVGEDPAVRRSGTIAADPVQCGPTSDQIFLVELAGGGGNAADPLSTLNPDGTLTTFGPAFPVIPTAGQLPLLLLTGAGSPPTVQMFAKVLQVVNPGPVTAPNPCSPTPMSPTLNLRVLIQLNAIQSGVMVPCTSSLCPAGAGSPAPARAQKVYALNRWLRYMVYKPPATPPPSYPGLYVQTSGPDGDIGPPKLMVQGVEDMQVGPILTRSVTAGGSCNASMCLCEEPTIAAPGPWLATPLLQCGAMASGWPYAATGNSVDSGHVIGMMIRLVTLGAHPLKDDGSSGGKRPKSYDRPAMATPDGLMRQVKEFRVDFRNLNSNIIDYN